MKRKHSLLKYLFIFFLICLLGFNALQFAKNLSPQATLNGIYKRIRPHKSAWDQFPAENEYLTKTILERSEQLIKEGKEISREELKEAYGVYWENDGKDVKESTVATGTKDGLEFREGRFKSFDGLEVPFYQIFPTNFDQSKKYPTAVLFSGTGAMDEVAFKKLSYQKGLGLSLAHNGYMVFVMENRGMGKLSYLGSHHRMDAVARLIGSSFYGLATSDGLYLLDLVFSKPYTGKVGVAGLSAGGALSFLTGAIDERISASYVQGYLGTYALTFGTRANHDMTNDIANVLNHFEMDAIGKLIYPRAALYVNGELDTFYPEDAQIAFDSIQKKYAEGGYANLVELKVPADTVHEITTDICLDFFNNHLLN